MKKIVETMLLSGLLTFLFGCNQSTVTKADLIGIWQGETQNNVPIKNQGFYSIKLIFTHDSVEVITDMNAFGGRVTTKSISDWDLNKNIIKTKFGDNIHECSVTLDNGTLTFKPDLFFKPEAVRSSQYKKKPSNPTPSIDSLERTTADNKKDYTQFLKIGIDGYTNNRTTKWHLYKYGQLYYYSLFLKTALIPNFVLLVAI